VPLIGEDSPGEPSKVKRYKSKSTQIIPNWLLAALLRRPSNLSLPARGPVLLVLSSLCLGSCASVSATVSDHWPTWAGGMPNDVPPRPGAPGYEEFLAHQQRQDAAAASPSADGNTQATSIVASPNKMSGRPPPAKQPAENSGAAQGGLY
jgi:hypothetical protein